MEAPSAVLVLRHTLGQRLRVRSVIVVAVTGTRSGRERNSGERVPGSGVSGSSYWDVHLNQHSVNYNCTDVTQTNTTESVLA